MTNTLGTLLPLNVELYLAKQDFSVAPFAVLDCNAGESGQEIPGNENTGTFHCPVVKEDVEINNGFCTKACEFRG